MIVVGSMYRPPNHNLEAFITHVSTIVSKVHTETNKELILGMDHNLDLLKLVATNKAKYL